MSNNPLHKDVCEVQESTIVRFNYDAGRRNEFLTWLCDAFRYSWNAKETSGHMRSFDVLLFNDSTLVETLGAGATPLHAYRDPGDGHQRHCFLLSPPLPVDLNEHAAVQLARAIKFALLMETHGEEDEEEYDGQ